MRATARLLFGLGLFLVCTAQSFAQSRSLTQEDVTAWLDGLMPYALHQGDIAGAEVVIVKDGKILAERGYGYADVGIREPMDPRRTIVRFGSTSKLFTWTAVMQLVAAGRLDLDADVNRYLDFKIPPYRNAPITLRQIMTHRTGFEEEFKGLGGRLPGASLETYVKSHLPQRVFPPEEIPAYSNYAAALAGYVVQRASGEPFADYQQRHILIPLGMRHSSFRQPLPPDLAHRMSRGYRKAGDQPQYFEIIDAAPAGALSGTADDMSRFMIAHLQNGRVDDAEILPPASAIKMHAQQSLTYPALSGMTLGFYETNRNGHRVLAHNGATQFFESDLHLFIDDDVGIFVCLNSEGADDAPRKIEEGLFKGFADRYFPAERSGSGAPTLIAARAHGEWLAGYWASSRRHFSSFMSLLTLVTSFDIRLNDDGTLHLPLPGMTDIRWHEIEPYVWQSDRGPEKIQALLRDGRPYLLGFDSLAPVALTPTPLSRSPIWLVPALGLSLIVLSIHIAGWPLGYVLRRLCRATPPAWSRALAIHRASQISGLAAALLLCAFAATIAFLLDDLSRASDATDPWLFSLEAMSMIAFPAAFLLAVWSAVMQLRCETSRARHGWSVMVISSSATLLWTAWTFSLMRFSTSY